MGDLQNRVKKVKVSQKRRISRAVSGEYLSALRLQPTQDFVNAALNKDIPSGVEGEWW